MRFPSLKLRTQHEAHLIAWASSEGTQENEKKQKATNPQLIRSKLSNDVNLWKLYWLSALCTEGREIAEWCSKESYFIWSRILRNVHQVLLLCMKQCWVCSCKEQPKLRVPHKSKVCFLAISQFDWPIAKKKNSNYGSTPKIEDFMERWSA
jgi:hypothetical protein